MFDNIIEMVNFIIISFLTLWTLFMVYYAYLEVKKSDK